ncbi:helix-turn-helix domain-containing protein [Sphingomonas desiccabilis]|uniref:helix-turn-helix domain-containing protein n=1 Tax=Sphingomonas desiccabilis TaxID=429134 RepID=UPI001826C5BC|nr:LuxR C-terminal-related transcriptional regulator [Sphingomonas desiccabilis]MBB3912403.1 DNA-binding NarL/FixJ family response regulator [Sphingomonas desiccabilis]
MGGTAQQTRRSEPLAIHAGETGLAQLTPTQIKVLRGVHSGLLNKQIAFDLGIAEATVKAHMTALMRKLNVRNRTQVAIAAQALTHHLS